MSGPITTGKDFNFFKKVTVSNSPSFNTDPDVIFNFRGQQSFTLINEGSGVIEYSFNGNTLHGDMTPSTTTASLTFNNRRVSQIWLRLKSGSPSIVRIEAWAAI